MSEPGFADEFAYMADNAPKEALGGYVQVYRDRILAALRGNEEDARIAAVVRKPTNEQARALFWATDEPHAKTGEAANISLDGGLAGFAAILALANEAGERDA